MRGKALYQSLYVHELGITPAYAGKSVVEIAAFNRNCGITPAYAGKRLYRRYCALQP